MNTKLKTTPSQSFQVVFSVMWRSTQRLKRTTLWAQIQNNPSHDCFSLRHDKPKPAGKVEFLQTRVHPGCQTSVRHIEQKQPRWKTGNKNQIHARRHLPACSDQLAGYCPTGFLQEATQCVISKDWNNNVKKKDLTKTCNSYTKGFKLPKKTKMPFSGAECCFLPLPTRMTRYNYEQWAQPLHVTLNPVCIRGCL